MNEQTAKLLRELAEKLGTTTEYLWTVLLRQAPISAWTQLLVCGLLIAVMVAAIRWWKEKGGDIEEWQCGIVILSMFIGGLAILYLVCEAHMIMAGLLNPEYWALKQILK